jgi:hypothetical protein
MFKTSLTFYLNRFKWWWFIGWFSYDDYSFHNILFYQIPPQNLFSPFPSEKAQKDIFSYLCFLKVFSTPYSQANFQYFSTNLHLISCQLNWNSIPFKFQSTYLNWLNSKCMQCHSIVSFKWNSIFTKSIQLFLINWWVDCEWCAQ